MYLLLYVLFTTLFAACRTEKIRYISTEHPMVTYINPEYVSYANLTAKRYGRGDPLYYVALNFYLLKPFHNNITVDFYFYEFLTNRYKRGFVEMHFKFCDLIEKDQFFGSAMRQGKLAKPCPYGPGAYNLSNMTIPLKQIPHNFPFSKGRIYCNFTGTVSKVWVAEGYIDMEIKEAHVKIRYISTEHPMVTYINTEYVSYANLTAKRYGRGDPFYYVGLNFYLVKTIHNNVTVDFYFYEFLTNRYKRGFVEMHFKFCDLIENNFVFNNIM